MQTTEEYQNYQHEAMLAKQQLMDHLSEARAEVLTLRSDKERLMREVELLKVLSSFTINVC